MATVNPPPIAENILKHIGNTPMVRLDKIAKEYGLKCELRTWFPPAWWVGLAGCRRKRKKA